MTMEPIDMAAMDEFELGKMHVGDALFDEQGDFDADRMTTIGRMGGEDYVRTRDRFSLPRPKTPR